MSNIISLTGKHWLYIFAGLSRKNKKHLERYFSTIYPRSYVKKLVSMLEESDVQLKKSQHRYHGLAQE